MTPRHILIATEDDDFHASRVAWALEELGHQPYLWFGADLPTRSYLSVSIGEPSDAVSLDWSVGEEGKAWHGTILDTVWFRRAKSPHLPRSYEPDPLHPEDRVFAEQQNAALFNWIWHALGRNAHWVNPLAGKARGDSKLTQLDAAQRVGLTVPRSYFGNEPERMRAFIRSCSTNGAIYKPVYGHRWLNEQSVKAYASTKDITVDQLPDDDVLRLASAILQEKVPKAYELRVTVFGRMPVAVKIRSQEQEGAEDDWRVVDYHSLPVEPYSMPASLTRQLMAIMDDLGIVFGCFDLIRRPDGTYVFLEVNEMGQFLWLEEILPEIPMLDYFVRFLTQRYLGADDLKQAPRIRLENSQAHKRFQMRLSEKTK